MNIILAESWIWKLTETHRNLDNWTVFTIWNWLKTKTSTGECQFNHLANFSWIWYPIVIPFRTNSNWTINLVNFDQIPIEFSRQLNQKCPNCLNEWMNCARLMVCNVDYQFGESPILKWPIFEGQPMNRPLVWTRNDVENVLLIDQMNE